MPIHVHPVLRSLEEVEESAGLIVTLNSSGVTNQIAAEAAGTVVKSIPVNYSRIINGKLYTVNPTALPPTTKSAV